MPRGNDVKSLLYEQKRKGKRGRPIAVRGGMICNISSSQTLCIKVLIGRYFVYDKIMPDAIFHTHGIEILLFNLR